MSIKDGETSNYWWPKDGIIAENRSIFLTTTKKEWTEEVTNASNNTFRFKVTDSSTPPKCFFLGVNNNEKVKLLEDSTSNNLVFELQQSSSAVQVPQGTRPMVMMLAVTTQNSGLFKIRNVGANKYLGVLKTKTGSKLVLTTAANAAECRVKKPPPAKSTPRNRSKKSKTCVIL